MRRPRRMIQAGMVLVAGAAAAGAAPQRSLDVTAYPVVVSAPGAAAVETVRIRYRARDGVELDADLYLPTGRSVAAPAPAVVFANGVGGRLLDWEGYRTWGRLVAAHGLAGVTAESRAGSSGEDLEDLLAHLAERGPDLNVDPARVALWACSANVPVAAAILASRPAGVRAAVLYYGSVETAELPDDLPVLYVMAGRDAPSLKAAIRRAWGAAVERGLPWTMVAAPGLTHAFDVLDEGTESRGVVSRTVAYLTDRLAGGAEPGVEPARAALQHVYGHEWEAAAGVLAEMAAHDPGDAEVRAWYGTALLRTGHAADAAVELEKAVTMGHDNAPTRVTLAQALLAEGRLLDAEEALVEARRDGVETAPVLELHGTVLLRLLRFDEAVQAFRRQAALPGQEASGRYNEACALAVAGRTEAALDALEAAVGAGFADAERLRDDPDLASLRHEPRFAAVAARAGGTSP